MSRYNMDKNFVKNIRTILEGEVEEAEVIMAARGFSKEFQDMIQKVGRLANEQVGPVVDQIRLTYGPEMAESFQSTVRSQMDTVLNAIAAAKDTLDNVVLDITDGQLGNIGGRGMPSNDMSAMGGDEGSMGGDEVALGDEAAIGGDEGGDEMDAAFDDEFNADEPMGRNKLESVRKNLERKIVEMRKELAKERKVLENKAMKRK